MAQNTKHFMDEDDIGSGEKLPGQNDVEQATQSLSAPVGTPVKTHPLDGSRLHQGVEEQEFAEHKPTVGEMRARSTNGEHVETNLPGRLLQSGTHIARIFAEKQPDETFEAQVFLRLTREPELAETYIPVGIFATEAEAWAAAEERAKRAFKEHEF